MNDIIEIIKSFTKEEVTDLTDHLLTIQANDQSINDLSWHTVCFFLIFQKNFYYFQFIC